MKLLDNHNDKPKVHEFIEQFTREGKMDIVTGYFTVGALAWLSKNTNEKIEEYRMILGDISNNADLAFRPIDLLNENISIDAALKLSQCAKDAVDFLKKKNVGVKTLEPNFCHAKLYLHKSNDPANTYYISGSSNLTEAGIGLKFTNNLELNLASKDDGNDFEAIQKWFEDIWESEKAHTEKTVEQKDGTQTKVDFKKYLIGEISKIFVEYDPQHIYYKILFELYGSQVLADQNDPNFTKQIGKLENTKIYKSLYDFQQKGVLSLIRMLQKYNGAILADAVGLGKTWSALAVIKFYQLQGREVVLICPKKLEHNWRQYLRNQESRFEEDQFDYFVRFHTDMYGDRLEKYKDRADHYFSNDKPKLIVIDESHNLRNHKSSRYEFLMEILQKNDNLKVLLLSATPINNHLTDIKNQFMMMVKGDKTGFEESLDIKNLDACFREAKRAFIDWKDNPAPKIKDLIRELPEGFYKLTDALIVARTRKMIQQQQTDLVFPKRSKPDNYFVTPNAIGNYNSFEKLLDKFPPMLSGYQPSFYIPQDDDVDILHDEQARDRFLVNMMYILMVKRLESSWKAFHSTIQNIMNHHQNIVDKIDAYKKKSSNTNTTVDAMDDTIVDQLEEDGYTVGKRAIRLQDIDQAGNLDIFRDDLVKDIDKLEALDNQLKKLDAQIQSERDAQTSKDTKLQKLIEVIKTKQASGNNHNNQKVIIFTVYADTANYLYTQLRTRGIQKLAMVTGTETIVFDQKDKEAVKVETILQRFAPYTKLFNEKEHVGFETDKKGLDAYEDWLAFAEKNEQTYHALATNPIDVLIATDVLSEGQNLQDADMVINYDIHWNPVRIIQRLGRIDRIGSPNESIYSANFWPSNDINGYLNLQDRIQARMASMKIAGSEVDPRFTEEFGKMVAENQSYDQKLNDKMLKQMEITMEDIDGEESFGLDDLSLEKYRQDLVKEYSKNDDFYRNMPNGVFSGFKAIDQSCPKEGIIALLGYPAASKYNHTYKQYNLIYIDYEGKEVLLNPEEVLGAVSHHKDANRALPDGVDKGEQASIQKLSDALKMWLKNQVSQTDEDGNVVAGNKVNNAIGGMMKGSNDATNEAKEGSLDQKYQADNFDLITWLVVSK